MSELNKQIQLLEKCGYKHLIEEFMHSDLSFEEFIKAEQIENILD